jgi:hypothetical protein
MPDLPPQPARALRRPVASCPRAVQPWRWRRVGWLLLPLAVLAVPVVAATTPAPVKRAPSSDMARWLATADAQWQADYQRDVAGPYEKSVAEARKQYLTTLEGALDAASKAGTPEQAAAWRAERDRISSEDTTPVAEDAKDPAPLKAVRTKFRAQLAQLDRERFERARGLFSRCDASLVKKQATVQPRLSADDSTKLQAERDQLRTAWLQPPAVVEAPPVHPPPGGVATPAKLTSQQILEKLLAVGAGVSVKPANGPALEVKPDGPAVTGKFTFERVSFPAQRPDETPLVVADYDILDSLSEVQDLGLSGPVVRDAVMEKLRSLRALRDLSLDRVAPSPAGYAVLADLSELRSLSLQGANMTDEGMQWVTKCHKLQRLHLGSLAISNDGLANLGDLRELEELDLNELDKLDSKGFAYLADCRALKYVSASGFVILSGMVENLGKCKNLESVNLPNTLLKDTEIAPLGALEKLHSLNLSNASVAGAVFAKWPIRRELTSLNLEGALGVDDAACKSIERSFPKLQELRLKLAETGFSAAGATALGRLHELHALALGGGGITNNIVDEITHAKTLTSLSIPLAQVTDPGAAAIGRLSQLTELSLDIPPITEAALKSFARCKVLKNVNIGKDAAPETEYKLESVLPGATVHRPEE